MIRKPRSDPKKQTAIGTIRDAGGERHLLATAALAASRAGCPLAEIASAMASTEDDAARAIWSARREERDTGVVVVAAWRPAR